MKIVIIILIIFYYNDNDIIIIFLFIKSILLIKAKVREYRNVYKKQFCT